MMPKTSKYYSLNSVHSLMIFRLKWWNCLVCIHVSDSFQRHSLQNWTKYHSGLIWRLSHRNYCLTVQMAQRCAWTNFTRDLDLSPLDSVRAFYVNKGEVSVFLIERIYDKDQIDTWSAAGLCSECLVCDSCEILRAGSGWEYSLDKLCSRLWPRPLSLSKLEL